MTASRTWPLRSAPRGGIPAASARFALVLAGVGLAVTACTPPTHYLPEPAALQDRFDCDGASEWRPGDTLTDPPAKLTGSVPAGFMPVDVVRCSLPHPTEPGQPVMAAVTEDHLAGDYGPLLAALAEPSDRGGARNCLDYADVPPQLWLVNAAGKAVHVQWPLDNCEHLKPATAQALNALTVTKTITIPLTSPAKDSTP